ncbi:MAG: DUF3857 domain-containing protein [Bryobacteraceae bacterium]
MRYPVLWLMILCSVVCCFAAEDQAPQWLKDAAAKPVPAYTGNVPFAVLLRESSISMDETGRKVATWRFAMRILSLEGKKRAIHGEEYNVKTDKVRELHAWAIMPSGTVKEFGKESISDRAIVGNDFDLYRAGRVQRIDARAFADPGTVVGFETVLESRSVFSQWGFTLQGSEPVLDCRISVTLPAGWRAEGVLFNAPQQAPSVSGSTYAWEMRDLPFIEKEPEMPRVGAKLAPYLVVSAIPPEGSKTAVPVFKTWADVATWLASMEDPQVTPDDAIREQAQALIAGKKTLFEKIQAIGRFVQDAHNVSLDMGLSSDGGFQPHPAAIMLRKGYGNCKDKANLMRSLLRSVGIDAYMISITAADRSYVREEWPSPYQFNHTIVAVKVDDTVQAPAVLQHPVLGRLLFFDPTDPYTSFSYLPAGMQDSWALIDGVTSTPLVKTPGTVPSDNRTERDTEAVIGANGAVSATVKDRYFGSAASDERALLHKGQQSDYLKAKEQWINESIPGASVGKIEPEDTAPEFHLNVEMAAPSYAKVMRGNLLMFKAALVGRNDHYEFAEPTRKSPVMLHSHAFTETARIKLPAGFKVDELPDTADFQASFGKYHATWKVDGGELVFTRALEIQNATIPAEKYSEVQGFFQHVIGAERAPVVLVR